MQSRGRETQVQRFMARWQERMQALGGPFRIAETVRQQSDTALKMARRAGMADRGPRDK